MIFSSQIATLDRLSFGMLVKERSWSAPTPGVSRDVDAVSMTFNRANKLFDPTYGDVVYDKNEMWYSGIPGAQLDLVADANGGLKIEVHADASTSKYLYYECDLDTGITYSANFDLDFIGTSKVGFYVRYLDTNSSWNYLYQDFQSSNGTYNISFSLPNDATGAMKFHYIQFDFDVDVNEGHTLINAKITGNVFPASEHIIFDENGTGVMIGYSTAIGGPKMGVWGSGEENTLSNFSIKVQTDEDGNFTGVYLKNSETGEVNVISIADWNSKFEDVKVWDEQDGRTDYEEKDEETEGTTGG